jgi:hypothetical protein
MSGSRVTTGIGVLLVLMMLSPTAGAQQIVMDANTLTARVGGTPVLQYRYANVPFKPYIKELCTPSGINVLLDAPPDHLHHHALMFACAVDNVDFWGEAVGPVDGHFEHLPGKQEQVGFYDIGVTGPEGSRWAKYGDTIRWLAQPNNDPLLNENRHVMVGRFGESKTTFLWWESSLSPGPGKKSAVLTGSHYHGLGLRFIRSMDSTGEFRNPDNDPGVIFRGEERLTRSRWCAYTAQANGKTVTVAMFDHRDNPRQPATWFTMAKPFAYMSATLRLHEEPLKLVSGKRVTLRYGVAVWDGRPEISEIDALHRQWNAMVYSE